MNLFHLRKLSYDPFGKLMGRESHDVLTPFLYNGRDGVMTDENGLYYMRARYYNPDTKRFLGRDTLLGSIAEGQTLNRYSYVTGDPISLIDPFGLSGSKDSSFTDKALGIGGDIADFLLLDDIKTCNEGDIIHGDFTGFSGCLWLGFDIASAGVGELLSIGGKASAKWGKVLVESTAKLAMKEWLEIEARMGLKEGSKYIGMFFPWAGKN